MTYEEAMKIIHPDTSRKKLDEIAYYGGFDGYETMVKAIREARTLACEAMELQVAKKPTAIDERIGESYYYLAFVCPTCDEAVIGQPYRPNYCKHCGQKLDFGE